MNFAYHVQSLQGFKASGGLAPPVKGCKKISTVRDPVYAKPLNHQCKPPGNIDLCCCFEGCPVTQEQRKKNTNMAFEDL